MSKNSSADDFSDVSSSEMIETIKLFYSILRQRGIEPPTPNEIPGMSREESRTTAGPKPVKRIGGLAMVPGSFARLADIPQFQKLQRDLETAVAIGLVMQTLIPLHATWYSAETAAKAGKGELLRTTLQEIMGPMAEHHAAVIKLMADCGFPQENIETIKSITAQHLEAIHHVLDGTDKGKMLRELAEQQGAGLSDELNDMIEQMRGGAPTGPRPTQAYILQEVRQLWRDEQASRTLVQSANLFYGTLQQEYQRGGKRKMEPQRYKTFMKLSRVQNVGEYVENLHKEYSDTAKNGQK